MNAPYATKILKKTGNSVMAYQSTWLVEDTIAVSELELCPRAVLKAPEGKFLTLTVNGVGSQIKPGTYKGDVVLSVTDAYHMASGRPDAAEPDRPGVARRRGGGRRQGDPHRPRHRAGRVQWPNGKAEGVYMASTRGQALTALSWTGERRV